jgi:hypothetical protein
MYRAKKISKGEYIYRGFRVYCFGYYEPEQRVVWEAVDSIGDGVAHGFSKKSVMRAIDYFMDKE